MTKSQINKLGERLRVGPVTDALLEQLQQFRAGYAAPMINAQTLIKAALGLEATARLKTVNTTLEKLRREKTRLASVQDIAGLRLVGDWTLDEQDAVVAQLLTLFSGALVRDRRSTPSHGYRAVHVVPTVEGYPLEIQVRTLYQDGWAQAMEKLADIAVVAMQAAFSSFGKLLERLDAILASEGDTQ